MGPPKTPPEDSRRALGNTAPAAAPRTPEGDDPTAVDLTREASSRAPARDDTGDRSPRLPHERDEGVGMTDGRPDARIKKAQEDLERGVKDTSRAPEADRIYRRLKTKKNRR